MCPVLCLPTPVHRAAFRALGSWRRPRPDSLPQENAQGKILSKDFLGRLEPLNTDLSSCPLSPLQCYTPAARRLPLNPPETRLCRFEACADGSLML